MNIKKRREERIRELFRGSYRTVVPHEPGGRRPEQSWGEWRTPPTRRQVFLKLLICIVLYGAIWGVFHIDHPLAERVKSAVRTYLTESYDFAAAADWYNRHIGQLPTFLPAFDRNETGQGDTEYTIPVSDAAVSPYSASGQGVWLSTRPNQTVTAIGAGLVERVEQHPDTGLTVTVRHAGGITSYYGFLESVSVEKNDWLKGGAEIGKVKSDSDGGVGKLYFAVKQNKTFIDPGDVVPLD